VPRSHWWRAHCTGRTFIQADFNGDGTTDSADSNIWYQNSGRWLYTLVLADFNDDDVVNSEDYGIWSANNGQYGGREQGDADGNGFIDGNDLIIWQRQLGLQLDWEA
jgi:hypothetical protein